MDAKAIELQAEILKASRLAGQLSATLLGIASRVPKGRKVDVPKLKPMK